MKGTRIMAAAMAALLALFLVPTAGAARNRAPKIKKAQMQDANGNGIADRVVLTYSEPIKHKRDTKKFPFTVTGWKIREVKAARKKPKLVIILKENASAPAAPDIKYKKTRRQPVKDVSGKQAKGQLFLKTIGLDVTPPPPPGEFTLTVTHEGPGTVNSSPAGISCGTTCSATFAEGTQVTLTETPEEGGSWVGWEGACSGEATTCVITMDADKTVTATFAAAGEAVLSISKIGEGKVSSVPSGIDCGVTCSHTYTTGDQVTLTATPDSGGDAKFVGWSGGVCSGTAPTCTVTMTSSKSVVATFTWSLNATRTGPGTVTSSPAGINCGNDCVGGFAPSSSVTLTATPDAGGATFKGWGGDCTGTVTTCTLSMTEVKDVIADFEPPPGGGQPVLTVIVIGDGNVTSSPAGINCGGVTGGPPPCNAAFDQNTPVTLTALPTLPNTNAAFVGCGTQPTPLSCSVNMDANKEVTVTFSSGGGIGGGTQTLTVAKSGTGSGTVTSVPVGINCGSTCSSGFADNSPVVLTAFPDLPGSMFAGWSGDCSGAELTCNVTMTSAKSVTANFAPLGPAIKVRFF